MNRSTSARLAAHTSWANTSDRAARSSGGQRGLRERFDREARELLGADATDAAVAASAESLYRAHFVRLAASRKKAS